MQSSHTSVVKYLIPVKNILRNIQTVPADSVPANNNEGRSTADKTGSLKITNITNTITTTVMPK